MHIFDRIKSGNASAGIGRRRVLFGAALSLLAPVALLVGRSRTGRRGGYRIVDGWVLTARDLDRLGRSKAGRPV